MGKLVNLAMKRGTRVQRHQRREVARYVARNHSRDYHGDSEVHRGTKVGWSQTAKKKQIHFE